MTDRVRHGLAVVAWLIAVILIALGGAGLVAATDPGTGSASQARLTYTADAELAPALDAAEADLATLADDVDALGSQARGALAATIGGDPTTVNGAVAAGDTLLAGITARSKVIATDLAAIPYMGTPEAPLHVSPPLRARHARLDEALKATDGLQAAWAGLTTASAAAADLASELAEHDRLVGEAAQQGRDASYKKAIKTLKAASASITTSKAHARHTRRRRSTSRSSTSGWAGTRPTTRRWRPVRGARLGGRPGHEQGAQGDRRREGRAGKLPPFARAGRHHGRHRPGRPERRDRHHRAGQGRPLRRARARDEEPPRPAPIASGVSMRLAAGTLPEPPTRNAAEPPAGASPTKLSEVRIAVQLRVVNDQPWDVAADVLVVPIAGEVAFEGPLDETTDGPAANSGPSRPSGSSKGKRYATALAASGEIPVERVVVVGVGRGGRARSRDPRSGSRRPPNDAWPDGP